MGQTGSMTIDEFRVATRSGRIFTTFFFKKSTGELRVMVARCGVKQYLTGAGAKYDFAAKGLLPVFDMQARDYRSISLANMLGVRMDGREYAWDGEKLVEGTIRVPSYLSCEDFKKMKSDSDEECLKILASESQTI